MIPDKHPETSGSPSLPRRSGGAVTAPLCAFHLPLTLRLLISSIISPIWCPGRGKVGRRRPQFKSFNLTACGATAVSARCKYANFLSLMSGYLNEAAVRRLDLAPPLSEGAARPLLLRCWLRPRGVQTSVTSWTSLERARCLP